MAVESNKRLIYFENEEFLIRRLGAAVVVCWGELGPEVRDLLLDQAEQVLDKTETDEFAERVQHLLAEHGRGG